jgi:hypothetical protein
MVRCTSHNNHSVGTSGRPPPSLEPAHGAIQSLCSSSPLGHNVDGLVFLSDVSARSESLVRQYLQLAAGK